MLRKEIDPYLGGIHSPRFAAMHLSLCPAARAASPVRAPRRLKRIDRGQLLAIGAAFAASIPAGLLGDLLVEDARIATVFAMLVGITLLSLFSEPANRRSH
jgi:hypothetical protein